MITTKNRSAFLHKTLRVIKALNPMPIEVLITADGCTDDTVEVVNQEMPSATLIVNNKGLGSVASRDRMMRVAMGDLVLALDDDSYPEQVDCLKTLQDIFNENPRIAIATFPQRTDEYPQTLNQVNFGETHAVRSFPCSGACLRVSTYRSLQGFEPMFFHMYEEPDYSLQCVAAGWEVIYTPAITIRHYWTGSGRNELRNHHQHARNELWSTVMRCPLPQLFIMIIWRFFSHARYSAGRGADWFFREPIWWFHAVIGIPRALSRRCPVKWKNYRRWLSLP